MWPVKIHPMSIKRCPKMIFTREMKDFDTFTKIALKCWRFGKIIVANRLWEIAQSAINTPIWSYCWQYSDISIYKVSECSMIRWNFSAKDFFQFWSEQARTFFPVTPSLDVRISTFWTTMFLMQPTKLDLKWPRVTSKMLPCPFVPPGQKFFIHLFV